MLIDNDISVVNTDNLCKNKFFFVYLQLNFYQLAKYNRNNCNINMKHSLILTFLASLMLSFAQPVAAQHHRSQNYRTQVAAQQSATDDDNGIDAYSDTTSVDTAVYDASSVDSDQWQDNIEDAIRNFMGDKEVDNSWYGTFKFLLKGMLIMLCIVLILGTIVTLPFVLITWLIAKLLYRKRKNIMHGIQDMENEFSNISSHSSSSASPTGDSSDASSEQYANRLKYEYYWERGVKKFALGIGLLLAGWICAINLIMGIGALLVCYGLCQIYMSSKYK